MKELQDVGYFSLRCTWRNFHTHQYLLFISAKSRRPGDKGQDGNSYCIGRSIGGLLALGPMGVNKTHQFILSYYLNDN